MKPKRNLWPFGIILTFVLFLSGTVGLVVMACSQRVDLVSSNYYEQELKFQTHIDRLNRTQLLTAPAAVTYDAATRRIAVSLPTGRTPRQVSGSIQLYRPSAAGLDRQFDLTLDAGGRQSLDAATMLPGLWKVRVSWSVNGQDYYMDQKIVIGPA
jgi:nitrogen fixation protein FixH